MLTPIAAVRRAGLARASPEALPGVADPARGTRVAIGFPSAALALSASWLVLRGWDVSTGLVPLLGLMACAALAERMSVQIGPRTVYTPSVPPIVLAGLLGGPLAGAAAGVATQLALTDAVWRRRSAWGGLAALQGLAAGMVGASVLSGGRAVLLAAGLALGAVTLVNTGGRLLIMLDRHARPLGAALLNGLRVDVLEGLLVTPILAALALGTPANDLLAVLAMGAVVAGIAIAHRQGERYRAAIASEQAMARRDILTGAPNRRAFEEALAAEHARIVRGGQPAGLVVVDVDSFKAINDTHRHEAGDAVLIEIVGRLTTALRPTDVIARWGGDEITVLAPGIHGERQLEVVCERIRSLVADAPVRVGDVHVPVTLSVGGTILDGSVTPATALSRADDALYRAKLTRNTTAVALLDDALDAA